MRSPAFSRTEVLQTAVKYRVAAVRSWMCTCMHLHMHLNALGRAHVEASWVGSMADVRNQSGELASASCIFSVPSLRQFTSLANSAGSFCLSSFSTLARTRTCTHARTHVHIHMRFVVCMWSGSGFGIVFAVMWSSPAAVVSVTIVTNGEHHMMRVSRDANPSTFREAVAMAVGGTLKTPTSEMPCIRHCCDATWHQQRRGAVPNIVVLYLAHLHIRMRQVRRVSHTDVGSTHRQ
jgi:hypothetical protein